MLSKIQSGITVLKYFYPDLIDREVLGEAPGDPDQLCQLVVLPLLGWRLVLLVVHQQAHLQRQARQSLRFEVLPVCTLSCPRTFGEEAEGAERRHRFCSVFQNLRSAPLYHAPVSADSLEISSPVLKWISKEIFLGTAMAAKYLKKSAFPLVNFCVATAVSAKWPATF